MLDVIRQAFDSVDSILDGTRVLILVFSMMAGIVVRAKTGSTPLTVAFVPGLLGGAFAAAYLMELSQVRLAAEKEVNLLVAIAVGESIAVVMLMSAVRLVRMLTAARDLPSAARARPR